MQNDELKRACRNIMVNYVSFRTEHEVAAALLQRLEEEEAKKESGQVEEKK